MTLTPVSLAMLSHTKAEGRSTPQRLGGSAEDDHESHHVDGLYWRIAIAFVAALLTFLFFWTRTVR